MANAFRMIVREVKEIRRSNIPWHGNNEGTIASHLLSTEHDNLRDETVGGIFSDVMVIVRDVSTTQKEKWGISGI